MVIAAPTAREAGLALSLTILFFAGSYLGSQWLARAYSPSGIGPARPFAKYSAALGRAVAPAVRATLAPAMLFIGVATQHLAVVVLASVAALCACVGISLF